MCYLGFTPQIGPHSSSSEGSHLGLFFIINTFILSSFYCCECSFYVPRRILVLKNTLTLNPNCSENQGYFCHQNSRTTSNGKRYENPGQSYRIKIYSWGKRLGNVHPVISWAEQEHPIASDSLATYLLSFIAYSAEALLCPQCAASRHE